MVVLLYSSGSCCSYNEFKGIFTDKDTALNTYLNTMKKKNCKAEGEDYKIENVEGTNEYKCYIIWSDGLNSFDGYLYVEEVEENDDSYIY